MARFNTVMKVIGGSLLAVVVAGGTFLLVGKYTNEIYHFNEAIVINDDKAYSKSIEYTASIVPGGETNQSLDVKSNISLPVKCNFTFTSDKQSGDFSYLTYEISGIGEEVKSGNLKTAIENKESFAFSLKSREEVKLSITYRLDFAYDSNTGQAFDFSLVFNAEGALL